MARKPMRGVVHLRVPEHAVRYLAGMIEREREALHDLSSMTKITGLPTLGTLAAIDSLDTLEACLPTSGLEPRHGEPAER